MRSTRNPSATRLWARPRHRGAAVSACAPAPQRRHPSLEALENELRWITWARSTPEAPDLGVIGMAILPTVRWCTGPSDHPKSGDGLLPHPITWDRDHLVLFTNLTPVIEASWTSSAWGTRTSGRVRISVDADAAAGRALTIIDGDDLIGCARPGAAVELVELVVSPMSAMSIRMGLGGLAAQASAARWAIHEMLEPWLVRSLATAHRCVSAELNVSRVLDEFALEDLHTEVHLGAGSRLGLIDKVIDRLAGGSSRPGVDAGRYIATTFRRDAELAIRRRIDDPRWVGVALRRFAADHPEFVGRELIDRFNDSSCMAERVGISRAARALSPAIQPVVVDVPFELMVPSHDLVDDSWGADTDTDAELALVS